MSGIRPPEGKYIELYPLLKELMVIFSTGLGRHCRPFPRLHEYFSSMDPPRRGYYAFDRLSSLNSRSTTLLQSGLGSTVWFLGRDIQRRNGAF